ncbi:MAG: CehA/McbA family metallohydrolase [Candidatus Methanoperedens sp.]|nr:CehA/McbA family metallohydrolase [Candidatus Methanoperedens sp.]
MKSFNCTVAFLLCLILAPTSFAESDDNVELTLDIIDHIRDPVPYPGNIEIAFLGSSNETIFLKEITVDWGNKNISIITLNKTLTGIGSDYQKLRNISSTRQQNLTPSDISALSARISEGVYREKIIVDPSKIFNDGFAPDREKIIHLELFYIYNNKSKAISKDIVLKILPEIIEPQIKADTRISISSIPIASSSYYYGDLHVHSGYSSLIGGYDGDMLTPDDACSYELQSWWGSTIPDLRDQAQALGLNWFSLTDHSYCLDPDKFNNVRDWSQGNSTPDFIIIPSEELSVQDMPDDGSDGEPFCNYPNNDNVAHLGAHAISTFIPGGMCNGQISAQQGIDEVKSLGGFPIINHPFGGDFGYWQVDAWDWEANLSTSGETGVEIWNGESPDEVSINFWVSRLLRGLKTYAFSGTDEHGGASDEVVNGVYVSGSFNKANLIDALNKGHVFISNAPFLSLKSRTDPNIMMGDTVTVNTGDAVEFSVILNPQSSGRLTVHKGVIGENIEDNEAGWPKIYDNLDAGETIFSDKPDKKSYYRAEYAATDGSDLSAYTNPIWIKPKGRTGGPDSFGYTFKDSNSIGGPGYEWIEISGTGAEVLSDSDDEVVDNINIGFFFNYYGTDYSQLAIANNGLLFSSGTTWQYVNEPITQSPSVHGFIAPFWDDIITYDDRGAGTIYYQTIGTASNRMFVVEWYDNKHYGSSDSGVTFEAILYEGSNNIKFQYKDVDFGNVYYAVSGDNPPYNNGGSATVGIEGPSGDIGLQYSFNEPVITPGLAILFKFPQYAGTNLYLSKQAPVSKDNESTMSYTLFYHNFADTIAQNVVLEDTLPAEVGFISASDSGSYESLTRKVTWNIGGVAPSGNGYRTVTVRIPQSMVIGSVIRNNARINTSNLEVRYDDNEAYALTKVTGSTLPPNVSVEPNNGGLTPSVVWHTPTTFAYYSSCATDVGINIHISDGGPDITGTLVESSPNNWTYTTSFERKGAAVVTYIVTGCTVPSISFNIYIDPSGYIYDANSGNRISEASVWLQRPDGEGGWENVSTGQTPPIIQPDINPLITGADGQYQWDVLAGSYRVHVEALGYYPADSIVVSVPLPVADLHVGLIRMPDTRPPASVTNLHNTTFAQTYINWSWTNPEDTDFAGVAIYLDSVFQLNISSPMNYYEATGLSPDTLYELGTHTLDASGNINWTWAIHTARTAPLDMTPPATIALLSGIRGNNGWYISDVRAILTAADSEGGSGVDKTEYSFDNTTWIKYTTPFNISSEGTTAIYYRSVDNADNVESTNTQVINIDKTPPDISITDVIDGGCYNSNVTPRIAITDTTLNNKSITLNSAPYINGTIVFAEGSYTLVAYANDIAGNSVTKILRFIIDKTPPEVAIRFDTDSKDIKVYDNETGIGANYVAMPSKDGKEVPNEDNEAGWELRQYTLKDIADNALVVVLKHKKKGNEARVELISIQYNGAAAITTTKYEMHVKYSEEKNSLRELEQKFSAKNLFEAESKYSAKKDETEIKAKIEGQKEQKESLAGIAILEILTEDGSLKFRY